jgi:hypothetical protein
MRIRLRITASEAPLTHSFIHASGTDPSSLLMDRNRPVQQRRLVSSQITSKARRCKSQIQRYHLLDQPLSRAGRILTLLTLCSDWTHMTISIPFPYFISSPLPSMENYSCSSPYSSASRLKRRNMVVILPFTILSCTLTNPGMAEEPRVLPHL